MNSFYTSSLSAHLCRANHTQLSLLSKVITFLLIAGLYLFSGSSFAQCSIPKADPKVSPPGNFQYTTKKDGNWASATTWANGQVPPVESINNKKIKVLHNVYVQNNNLKLENNSVLMVTHGGGLTLRNGQLLMIDGDQTTTEKVIIDGAYLRTSGNVEQTGSATVFYADGASLEIGDEVSTTTSTIFTATTFTAGITGSAASFINNNGYRRLEKVCLNVTQDLRNAGGLDELISVCAEIGDRGVSSGPIGDNGGVASYDATDGGNFEVTNAGGTSSKVYNSEFYIPNGNVSNASNLLICSSEFRLTNGNFLNQAGGTITGSSIVAYINNVTTGNIINQGTWNSATLIHWRTDNANNPVGLAGINSETDKDQILPNFGNCGCSSIPCDNSQPRPIVGSNLEPANQTPCPGTIETYCIENDRGYLSFEWDVPRAFAGDPPTGWEIISGQGTPCVTVLVGHKPGTMKCKVLDPFCGTKVATLPVHPGNKFEVTVSGPAEFCPGVDVNYTANITHLGNGNGNINANNIHGTIDYVWTAPAGWVISGQGTAVATITPDDTPGQVCVTANYTPGPVNGNGNGVGNKKGFCNTSEDDCIDVTEGANCCPLPDVSLIGPDSVCAFDLAVFPEYISTLISGGPVTYSWAVPGDWLIMSDETAPSIEVLAGFDSGYITVYVTNACGMDADSVFTVSDTCGIIDPFPVELVNFQADRVNSGVALEWATAQELNNDHFVVERSLNGKSFEAIGLVQGRGNTNYVSKYSYFDTHSSRALTYYRLKQVDFDGKFAYSPVRTVRGVKLGSGDPIVAYPNPASRLLTLELPTETPDNASVTITTVTGQEVYRGTAADVIKNNNSVDMSLFNSGVYILNVSSGLENKSLRITKL